jgi:hypothetical protein
MRLPQNGDLTPSLNALLEYLKKRDFFLRGTYKLFRRELRKKGVESEKEFST